MSRWALLMGCAVLAAGPACADTLLLKDGTTLDNCYVRDEGIRILVWEKMADVGTPNFRIIPRSQIKRFSDAAEYKLERNPDWDVHPNLPDLSVTFISMMPRLAGLHGRVDYDSLGRPVLKGAGLPDLGERAIMNPEEVVKDVKLSYKPGEEITLTAHVKNLGFATAKPFSVVWLMDGKELKRDKTGRALKEMEEATFPLKWKWEVGKHSVTFRIETKQPEIAIINNEATDPLWGWSYYYVVSPGRAAIWHQNRTAYGTFSFEDYYRWHVDMMNTLFAASKYPSSPDGITARVRLDRIVYAEDTDAGAKAQIGPDGLGYHQGGWTWSGEDDKTKSWKPAPSEGRNSTEWSLPHELAHQLGVVDYYALDDGGADAHVWADNGEKVTHFQNHPVTMMHFHGPQVFSEADAGYFNMRWDKPGGYFGDYYFAIPSENFLHITDINGRALSGAKVEVFQRGVEVDATAPTGEDQGVKYYAVKEDGDFSYPVSRDAVIAGTTDAQGVLRMANRPAAAVRTLNGYERKPNPFGNINVVGGRGVMLVKVTKDGQTAFFSLEIVDFVNAWFRGQKDSYTTVLKTPFRSLESPLPPRDVKVERVDNDHVKVTWTAPEVKNERQYLEKSMGFRVYRRISDGALNARPWFPVATASTDTFEAVVDLRQYQDDNYWFKRTDRFAVSAIGELGIESELISVVLPAKQ